VIAHDPSKRLSTRSVLIVEPHEDLCEGIVSTLQRRDYICDAVATPEAAALMLRDHDYAYVVVDLDVPEPTFELVSSLSTDANVILLTANVASDNEFHVLRKPFSRDELLAHFVRPSPR
jgi:DNA-binding response OmpR family regulator